MRNPTVVFYVLYNKFYILLSFVFHLNKDFYGVHYDTGSFCFFLLQKDVDIFHEPIDTFYLFSSSERFWYLSQASF